MRIAVTGRPGIGKTTVCMKVYNALKDKMRISGFITREVRSEGKRVGFKLINLSDGSEEWLAKVGKGSFTVGKYAVFVDKFEDFLENVEPDSDLLIVDEVGPMELKSRKFVEFVKEAMEKENLLFTIHYKSRHWLVEEIKRNFKVYVLDENNRNRISAEIVEELG
ncbi:NTPase [Archaeoglobus sp.]